LIEQKRTIAQSVSDRCVVLGQGRIVAQGTPEQVFAQADVVSEWLLV
jgi:branched-chain amino acid transport system ATP-binding protein